MKIMQRLLDRALGFTAQRVGLPATVTLKPVGFAEWSGRFRPTPVAEAEKLLEGTLDGPRIWQTEEPPAVLPPLRLIRTDTFPQPWFASDPPRYRKTNQAFARLRDAVVLARSGLVMAGDDIVFRNDLRRWVPEHRLVPGFVALDQTSLVARKAALRPRRRLDQTVLVLYHAWHGNYGHWLFDCLPALRPWLDLLDRNRLAVLVPALQSWQSRTLELLGIQTASIVQAADETLLCANAVVPGLLTPGIEPLTPKPVYYLPQPATAVVETMRTLKQGVRPPTSLRSPEKIYISRRGMVSWRQMRNEAEVEAALDRLGFTIVRPQDLSFDEQVATFAGARVVVGPHGAGLTNAAFAPSGCLVVDLCMDTWGSRWMVRLTQMFDQHYLPLACATDAGNTGPVTFSQGRIDRKESYSVPVDDLRAVLGDAMQSLGLKTA
jgi:capsular polysaccharide biosynthesis protein